MFGKRFEQEARAASEVRDPHLVPVLEAGQADGRRYLAVTFVAGGTLEDHLVERGRLEVADIATYAQHVGAGLDALHKAESCIATSSPRTSSSTPREPRC